MDGAELFVGIDVSKAHLDVALSSEGEVRRFDNDPEGTGELVAWLGPRKPSLALEPGHAPLLRTAASEGEAGEGGPSGLYAEAPDDA